MNILFAIVFLFSSRFISSEDVPSYSIEKNGTVRDWSDPKYFESSIKQAHALQELKKDELQKIQQSKEEGRGELSSEKLITKEDQDKNNSDDKFEVNSLNSEPSVEKKINIKDKAPLKKKTEFLFNSSVVEDGNQYIQFENQNNYKIENEDSEELIKSIKIEDLKLTNDKKKYNSLRIKKILNRISKKSSNIPLQKKIMQRLQISINNDDLQLDNYYVQKINTANLDEKEDRFIKKSGIKFNNLAYANDYIDNYKYKGSEISKEVENEKKYNLELPNKVQKVAFLSKKDDIAENSFEKGSKQVEASKINQTKKSTPEDEIDIVPVRSQREFIKNQVIPPNLIPRGDKNQHIAKPFYSGDYKKIAFEIIGREDSTKILENVYKNLNNLDLLDEEENTLLMHAIIKRDYSAISMLIQYGVEVDKKNKEGFAALHLAASYADINSLFMLLLRNPNINIKDNNDNTPLMYLSAVGDLDIVKQFITKNPSLHEKNKFGWTALDFAKNNDNIKIYEYLLYLRSQEEKNK